MNLDLYLWAGLLIWLGVIALFLYMLFRKEGRSVGLSTIYLVRLWLIHWVAAALYILPWFSATDKEMIFSGFVQSVYAVLAFAVGVLILGPWMLRLFLPQAGASDNLSTANKSIDQRLPKIYMATGLLSMLVLLPLLRGVPTVLALLAAAIQFLVVGLALACWQAWQRKAYGAFARWLTLVLCFPIFTIVVQGYLGYGVYALLALLIFVATFVRIRMRVILISLVIGYLGLSLYVTYMRDRQNIRETVWSDTSIGRSFQEVQSTMRNFEWFNPLNTIHLQLINMRLNQNILVGATVFYLGSGYQEFAHGATFHDAAIALIPRILWPEKPVVAGSPGLVTAYTGIPVAEESTSVGIGQVMEFYINFGTFGVITGFLILGSIIAVFDKLATRALDRGNQQQFTLWFLPGLGFTQVGGSLVEITSTVAASFITVIIVNRIYNFFLQVGLRKADHARSHLPPKAQIHRR